MLAAPSPSLLSRRFAAACVLILCATTALAQGKPKPKPWLEMDYGPVISNSMEGFSDDNVVYKARALDLGGGAWVLFDTELLRVAAAWTGGRLNVRGTPFDGKHGPICAPEGACVSESPRAPGWAHAGSFEDPRSSRYGPLPRSHGRYDGFYLHGDRVVLAYSLNDGATKVLETFDRVSADGHDAIARTLEITGVPEDGLRLMLDRSGDGASRQTALVSQQSKDLTLQRTGQDLVLAVPAAAGVRRVKLLSCAGDAMASLDALTAAAGQPEDLSALTRGGGGSRWNEVLTTKGRMGTGDGAYVVDTITVPEQNPWKSRLRFGAFDFESADAALLSTWNGDVWRVAGLAGDLSELRWTRIATGLFDPLGLKIVDGQVYVHGRDGITRLHDLDGDGEIDWYENFNNDVLVTRNFHEFSFDLQTDAEGNFYMSKGGPVKPGGRGFDEIVPHHGTILKLSKDGSKLEVWATGLRAPNGIGVSPTGIVTSGDNQGTWMPACRLNYLARPGMFTSCVDTAHVEPAPTTYGEPLCWFPMDVDNSGGGQVWVTSNRWGPLRGRLLHQSYGTCNLYLAMVQELGDPAEGGRVQGGVVRLPLSFASSQMRARFNHAGDGQLYTVGFKGWQTRAAKMTAFQRVRYTGKPLHLPTHLEVLEGAVAVRFSDALDPELATDLESYTVEVWNYRWAEDYGSPEFRPSAPDVRVKDGEKNRDTLKVTKAVLEPDGHTVVLYIENLRPVMQMRIAYDLETDQGVELLGEIHNTIHWVPGVDER